MGITEVAIDVSFLSELPCSVFRCSAKKSGLGNGVTEILIRFKVKKEFLYFLN